MFVCGQEKQAVVVTKNKVLTVHVTCVCVFLVTLRKTLQAISKAQLVAEPIGK